MANINFDDFEREIQQAESYLKNAGNNAQPDGSTNSSRAVSTQPEPLDDTLYFASDLKSGTYGNYDTDEMQRFGLTSSAPSSNNMYFADSAMDTMHFGATTDSLDAQSQDQNTLFYASDVVSSNPRQYQHGLNTSVDEVEEETLSFLPSPRITPRPDLSYNDTFGESMAETVRFTKPSEPALRSVDGNNYDIYQDASRRNSYTEWKENSTSASELPKRQHQQQQSSYSQSSPHRNEDGHSKLRSLSASRAATVRSKTPTDVRAGNTHVKHSSLFHALYIIISVLFCPQALDQPLLRQNSYEKPTFQKHSDQKSPQMRFPWSVLKNCNANA